MLTCLVDPLMNVCFTLGTLIFYHMDERKHLQWFFSSDHPKKENADLGLLFYWSNIYCHLLLTYHSVRDQISHNVKWQWLLYHVTERYVVQTAMWNPLIVDWSNVLIAASPAPFYGVTEKQLLQKPSDWSLHSIVIINLFCNENRHTSSQLDRGICK